MAFLRIARGIVRGKRFTTRRKAAEYLYRVSSGTLKCADGGGKLGLMYRPEFDAPNPLAKPSERKFRPAMGGACRRVYSHGKLWRVTVNEIWQSDHANMEDALLGVRPIGVEPGVVGKGVVYVPQ